MRRVRPRADPRERPLSGELTEKYTSTPRADSPRSSAQTANISSNLNTTQRSLSSSGLARSPPVDSSELFPTPTGAGENHHNQPTPRCTIVGLSTVSRSCKIERRVIVLSVLSSLYSETVPFPRSQAAGWGSTWVVVVVLHRVNVENGS